MEAQFDGKIRKSWGQKSDFLSVCVTGKGMEKEKLLGDIPLPTGTGANMAEAAYGLFCDWGIEDRIGAFGFDTTTHNTGKDNGE